MIRLRARTQGLQGYIMDGLAENPETMLGKARASTTRLAREAEAKLPEPGSRKCPDCSKVLSRYTVGPECRVCSRRKLTER